VRVDLRSLIMFIIDQGGRNPIYTNLADEILAVKEGAVIYQAYHFEDYKLKVNRYIEHNRDHLA
jgi:type I restriction enzyme R subunit